jgi:aarF domain-containing kinase
MGFGAAEEFIRRSTTHEGSPGGSLFMSEANVSRLVDKLSRMRGAALKLGQFLSIQGNHALLINHHVYLTLN